MTAAGEYTELSVCTDCAMLIANGEEPPESKEPGEHAALIDARWHGYYLALGAGDEDDDRGFSMRSCDGCGSHLGGDRFAATAWVQS